MTKTVYDPNHPKRPIICFVGEVAHSSSAISGQVKMTPDGQVRWQFVSVNFCEPATRRSKADYFARFLVIKEIRFGGVFYKFWLALTQAVWPALSVFRSAACGPHMVLWVRGRRCHTTPTTQLVRSRSRAHISLRDINIFSPRRTFLAAEAAIVGR